MRVISSDGNMNVPYENHIFGLSENSDDTGNIYVTTYRGNRSIGVYPVEKAYLVFEEMIAYGNQEMKVYRMPGEEIP